MILDLIIPIFVRSKSRLDEVYAFSERQKQ